MDDPGRRHRDLADDDSQFTDIAGVDVHFKVAGEGPHTLVLLHHFFGHLWAWSTVQELLADTARTVAFDRPGFGLTERVPRSRWNGRNPYTRKTAAEITVGLLDHVGAARGVLVGASAGGTIALETWRKFPDRVAGIILIAPAITGDVGPAPALRPLLRRSLLRRLAPRIAQRAASELTHERVGRSWHDPARVTDDHVAGYGRPLAVPGWEHGFWDAMTAEQPPRHASTLATITVPTLVVAGESDGTIAPSVTRRVADRIPGAEFQLVPGCGHTPHEECPDQLAAIIAEFLRRI